MVSEYLHIDLSYGMHDEKECREYYVMDKDGYLYIKNMKIIEYNMDRITKYWYNGDKKKIEEYKYLIMLGLDRDSLNTLAEGDKYMEEYTKKVEELNDRDAYTPWITPEEDAEMILNTEKHISFDQGVAQGIEQGKEDRNIEVAKALLKKGVSMELISETIGLSLEQLNQLKEA